MRIFLLLFAATFTWILIISISFSSAELDRNSMKNTEPSSASDLNKGVSMRILWTVAGFKIGKKAIWGEDEANKFLFKPLDIDDNRITFDGRTCSNIAFKKKIVSTKKYLSQTYRLTPQDIGIEDKFVEVIRTNCSLEGFKEYMRLKDRRLVIHINGVFLFFEPAVAY